MWRKAMVYLGLGDDAEYERYEPDYDDEPVREHAGYQSRPTGPSLSVSTLGTSQAPPEESGIGAVRPIGRSADLRESAPVGQTVNPTGLGSSGVRPRPQVVRPIAITPNAKPHLVAPQSFNEAQSVADKFKGSQPVIMNLQGADRELSRRLIDFASGLCYGLGGQMERVASQVYLLTPSDVEVSPDERRRLQERDYEA